MLRNIFGVFIGMVGGTLLVFLSNFLMPTFYSPAEGLNMQIPEDFKVFVRDMPFNAKALVIIGHTWGALLAGFLGATIAHQFKFRTGIMAALIIVIATISYNTAAGHGFSFAGIDIPLTLLSAYLGARLGSRGEVIIDV